MANLRLIYVSLILLAWCRPARAQDVAIGPGLFTFPEIASRLSTPGLTVHCSGDLTQRAAFVYIKRRPRQQVVDLLSKALELQFEPVPGREHEASMQRDPAVIARDRKRLFQFAQSCRQFMRDQLDALSPYVGLSGDEAARIRSSIWTRQGEINSLEEPLEAQGLQHSEQYIRLEREFRWTMEVGSYLYDVAGDPRYVGLRANVPTVNDIEDAITGGHVVHLTDLDAAAAAEFNSWLPGHVPDSRADPRRYSQLAVGVKFVSYRWSFDIQPEAAAISYLPAATPSVVELSTVALPSYNRDTLSTIDCAFLGGTDDSVIRFAGLGTEATEWLANERVQTNKFLQTDLASTIASGAPAADSVTDFCRLVQAWSAALDHEAVMELWPQREEVPKNVNPRRFCLKDIYDGNKSPWSLEDSSGVLMVRNRLGFLDRWLNLPVASLVRLKRQIGDHKVGPLDPAPYSALMAYARESAAAKCVPWVTIGHPKYLGIMGSTLDPAVPAMLALAGAPQGPDAILKAAYGTSAASRAQGLDALTIVRMERVHSRAIADIVDALRRCGFDDAGSYASNFSDTLAASELWIRIAAEQRDSQAYTVMVDVRGIGASRAQATFTWAPK